MSEFWYNNFRVVGGCIIKKKFVIFISVTLGLSILILIGLFISLYLNQSFKITNFKKIIEIPYNSTFANNQGDACYGNVFKCDPVSIIQEGDVDTSKIGEYIIHYTYKFADKTITKEQTVRVKDYDKPVIEVIDDNFAICPNSKYTNFKVTAYDDYDGDLTDKVKQFIDNKQVVFQVDDSSNNRTEVRKDLTLIDDEKPVLTLNGDANIYLKINEKYTELGAKAMDNCDGDLTEYIQKTGKVYNTIPGEYDITYEVIDSSGNKASIVRKVFVYQEQNTENPTAKSIYLTFDDGPSAYTSKLLDVLKKYNVKATFFVTGYGLSKGYDDVILRAYQEGHTIGLHTDTHEYSIYKNIDTYFNDLYTIQEKVKNITGYTSTIIRFPGGSSNTISKNYSKGIMSTLTKEVVNRGYRYHDWNVDSNDAGGANTASAVYNNVIRGLSSSRVNMVLMHDIKSQTRDALRDIIRYAKNNGFTFATITTSTAMVRHGVNKCR